MIYIFLANGFEETEAVTPIDILRRCGKEVVTVGVGGGTVTSSHGITVVADTEDKLISLDEKLEGIILPGVRLIWKSRKLFRRRLITV